MDTFAWAAVGILVVIQLGQLTALFRLGGKINRQGSVLTTRMEEVDGSLGARIDALSGRMAGLEDRVNDLGARLDGRIDGVATSVNVRLDGLASRVNELVQRIESGISSAEATRAAAPVGYSLPGAPEVVSLEAGCRAAKEGDREKPTLL